MKKIEGAIHCWIVPSERYELKELSCPVTLGRSYDRQGEPGDICPVDLLYPKFDNCLHIVIAVEDDVLGDTVGIQPEP